MRILFVKLSSIGDIVHTLPTLAAVRARFPDARISWAVERRAAEILRGNLLIDELIEIDTRALRRRSENRRARFAAVRLHWDEIRRREFDIALDFQGLLKSAMIAKISRAKRRAGFSKEILREPASRFLLTETVFVPPHTHIIRKNLRLAEKTLDIAPAENLEFPIFTGAEHLSEAEKIIGEAGENFAILNPAGGWTTKLWRAEDFGALADKLWSENRLTSVVTTAPNETDLAERVARASRSGKVFAAQPSLKGFYELARRARVYVGGDTGPTHLAVAAKAPVVGIFGPTEWWRNGSPDASDICVERFDILCRTDCHRRRCANWICLDIAPDTVFQAVQKRLGKTQESKLSLVLNGFQK